MISKHQLISDIELQLLQGDVSDDSALEKDQVAFWISYHLNSIVASELNSKISKGEMIPSIYIKRAECEIPELSATNCGDDCKDRIFIEITDEILTLKNDGGIILVQTDEGEQIRKTSIETLMLFNKMKFAMPSDTNLLYYHQGKKIFIEGIKSVDIPFENINVFYVPKQDILAMADSDEVLISDASLPSLIDSVVTRGKLELYGTQLDTNNDGVDYKNPVYHQQIAKPGQGEPSEE